MAEKVLISFEVDNAGAISKITQTKRALGEDVPAATAKASKGLGDLRISLAAVAGAFAFVHTIRRTTQAFADFQTQTVNVQNITGYAAEEMAGLANQILKLPPSLGTATDLMRGLYQAISAGVPRENAIAFVAENAKAAKGNLADLTTTINASTSVLAAYNLKTAETGAVLDAMTKTVDLGKLTFGDLANNIGKGISIAAQAGVTYQELMATLASLTLSGLSTEEAMTGIRNILVATIKPTPQAAAAMRELGVEMSVGALKAEGFAAYMGGIATAVDGNAEATAALFPNIRALNSAMSLASEEGGARFSDMLDQINNSAGKVDANFARMSETVNAKMEQVSAQFERAKITFGEMFAPALVWVAEQLVKLPLMIDIFVKAFTIGLLRIGSSIGEVGAKLQKFSEGFLGMQGALGDFAGIIVRTRPFDALADMALGADEQIRILEESINDSRDMLDSLADGTIPTLETSMAGLTGKVEDGSDAIAGLGKSTGDTKDKIKLLEENTKRAADIHPAWTRAMEGNIDKLEKIATDSLLAADAIKVIGKESGEAANLMQQSFSDLLGRGFMGELESFSDLWDSLWQDLAKSMMGILGDSFEQAFKIGGGIGDAWDIFSTRVSENRLGAGIGGAGMVYGGYQQGGTGGLLMGAMGGAMAGAALAAPTGGLSMLAGALIGGILGGVASLFGGEDTPSGRLTVSPQRSSIGRELVGWQERDAFTAERVEEYRASIMGMNSILRLFGDGGLFDLIENAPTFSLTGEDAGQLATYFRERWLPRAMEEMFIRPINQGLESFGVDSETIAQLWDELRMMTGANQLTALEGYIGALVDSSRLWDDMDWNAIMDESRMDSMTAFLTGMQEAVDAVSNQMLGMDQMTLIERAGQADTINQLITQARQAEIQMLRQIDQMQKGINDSIDSQLESIRTGGMDEGQLRTYYLQQIESIMDQLRSGVTSPEMLQSLMGDLQRYTGSYQSLLGDALYEQQGRGWSQADYLTNILEEARGLSNDAFEAMRDQIRETNDALIAELERLITALTHYGDSIATGAQQTPQFDANIGVDVTIRPSEWFESWVETRINRAIVSYGAEMYGPH